MESKRDKGDEIIKNKLPRYVINKARPTNETAKFDVDHEITPLFGKQEIDDILQNKIRFVVGESAYEAFEQSTESSNKQGGSTSTF